MVVLVFVGGEKGSSRVGMRWEEEDSNGDKEDRRVWRRGGVVQLDSVGIHLGLSSGFVEVRFNIPGEVYGEVHLHFG